MAASVPWVEGNQRRLREDCHKKHPGIPPSGRSLSNEEANITCSGGLLEVADVVDCLGVAEHSPPNHSRPKPHDELKTPVWRPLSAGGMASNPRDLDLENINMFSPQNRVEVRETDAKVNIPN